MKRDKVKTTKLSNFAVDPAVHARLKEDAKQTQRTIAGQVRFIIDAYYKLQKETVK